jgi:DNA modification methylase
MTINKKLPVHFTPSYLKKLQIQSLKHGYSNPEDYIKRLVKEHISRTTPKKPSFTRKKLNRLKQVYKTTKGQILCGDSLDWLHHPRNKNTVDLLMTSPPFGLVSKKSYGNESQEDYCAWFRQFAEGFTKVLKDDGSLVIDISGSWVKGHPVRSLYHFDVLQMLCKEYGFFLCQEHYWWNPGTMPAPASWVTVERIRVKDAVNCIWWLSKTPRPKASNLNVLNPYSKQMESVLRNGIQTGSRPSGHQITEHFNKNNGGSIPPNLLAIANTDSNGSYFEFCKRYDLPVHPARFPQALPEYFIKFLTNKGDLVVDPFGGSSITGYVAEKLGRKWKTIEMNFEYAMGGVGRFYDKKPYKPFVSKYTIHSPCSVINKKSSD